MAWRRSDLPLHGDPAARFLPWILGFLVYLSALMVGCSLMIDQLADSWRASLAGNLTVELPIDPGLGTKERADRLDAVIDLITATPGVTGATVLEQAELERLLRPWLGDTVGELDVALPTMIAVTARPNAVIDRDDLRKRLAAIVPDTRLDDHGAWIDDALGFLRSMQGLAFCLVAMVLMTAAATVIFVTRTGLAVHQPVIEILHLVGAQDSYIARQFQTQSLRVSLTGGIVGTVLATLTLVAMKALLAGNALGLANTEAASQVTANHGLMHELSDGLGLTLWHCAVLALLPLAMSLLAMLTARWTVLRSIHRSL